MSHYLLVLCGPVCAGKTTTVDLLLASEPKLIRISRDKIKRFISDYSPKENNYKAFLDKLLLSFADQAFEHGFNIIIEGSPNLDMGKAFKELAENYSARYLEINLEASQEVITKRFYARLEKAKKEGFKLFNTTEERMLELNGKYMEIRNKEAVTIMTDTLTAEQVVEKVKEIIKE